MLRRPLDKKAVPKPGNIFGLQVSQNLNLDLPYLSHGNSGKNGTKDRQNICAQSIPISLMKEKRVEKINWKLEKRLNQSAAKTHVMIFPDLKCLRDTSIETSCS